MEFIVTDENWKENERATVKGFLCEGVEISSAYDFCSTGKRSPSCADSLCIDWKKFGESSGGSANAESLSVLLEVEMQQKILKGLFFPQLRLSGVFIHRMVWDSER